MGKYLKIMDADFLTNAAGKVALESPLRWSEVADAQYPNYQYHLNHTTGRILPSDYGEPCVLIDISQCSKLWGFSAGVTAYYGNNTIDYGIYSEIPTPSNWSSCVLGFGELHNMSEENALILPDGAKYIVISDYAGAGVTMGITAYAYTPYNKGSVFVKDYTSDILYGEAYIGSGGNIGDLVKLDDWCSILVKKSDCTQFTPLGFNVEAIGGLPVNAMGYNSNTPSHDSFVVNKEPIEKDVNNKYVAMFDVNNIVSYGINFDIASTIPSLKISFFK